MAEKKFNESKLARYNGEFKKLLVFLNNENATSLKFENVFFSSDDTFGAKTQKIKKFLDNPTPTEQVYTKYHELIENDIKILRERLTNNDISEELFCKTILGIDYTSSWTDAVHTNDYLYVRLKCFVNNKIGFYKFRNYSKLGVETTRYFYEKNYKPNNCFNKFLCDCYDIKFVDTKCIVKEVLRKIKEKQMDFGEFNQNVTNTSFERLINVMCFPRPWSQSSHDDKQLFLIMSNWLNEMEELECKQAREMRKKKKQELANQKKMQTEMWKREQIELANQKKQLTENWIREQKELAYENEKQTANWIMEQIELAHELNSLEIKENKQNLKLQSKKNKKTRKLIKCYRLALSLLDIDIFWIFFKNFLKTQ